MQKQLCHQGDQRLSCDRRKQKQADPYLHLKDGTDIPILCIHGDCDQIVEPANSVSFVKRINEFRDGLGELIMIRGGGHNDIAGLFLEEPRRAQRNG